VNDGCRNCGARLSVGAFLCPACGVPVASASPKAQPTWGELAIGPSDPPAAPRGYGSQPTDSNYDDLPAALGGSLGPPRPSGKPSGRVPPPRPPVPRASVPQPPPRSHEPTQPALFASDDGPSLELAVDSPYDAPRTSQAAPAGPRLSAVPVAGTRTRGDRSTYTNDSGGSFRHAEPQTEAAALARYGPVPNGAFASAYYAIRVGLRRMELKTALTRTIAERGRAAAEADRALTALGQALYHHRRDPRVAAFEVELERVMAADQTLGERHAAHQDARSEVISELSTLDQVVADTSATIDPVREHEANLQRYLSQLEDNSKRAQARRQRVEIQIRGLRASQKDSNDPELLPTLEAELRVREQEVRSLAEQMNEVRQGLGEARRELAAHLGTLEALQEDLQGRKRALQQKDDIHKSYGGVALDAMTYALRQLAHAALNSGLFVVAETESRKAEAAVTRLKDRDNDEVLHREALDCYDLTAVRTGIIVIVASTVGFVILLRVIRSMGGHF